MVKPWTMNSQDLEILVNMSAGRTKPPDYAVRLLEDTCTRTGLDWKRRHVYLMERGGKWAVTLSIDGFRLIGSGDPEYAGQEGPFWTVGADSPWTDIPPETKPYAAKVGIKHRNGVTTWGVAKFSDYKAGMMWDKFPSTMVAKCAEMLAWRKAMPGRLGGLYGLEEMAQADKNAQAKLDENEKENAVPEDMWGRRIGGVKSLEELKAVGKAIAEDNTLTQAEIEKLHAAYQEAKARY